MLRLRLLYSSSHWLSTEQTSTVLSSLLAGTRRRGMPPPHRPTPLIPSSYRFAQGLPLLTVFIPSICFILNVYPKVLLWFVNIPLVYCLSCLKEREQTVFSYKCVRQKRVGHSSRIEKLRRRREYYTRTCSLSSIEVGYLFLYLSTVFALDYSFFQKDTAPFFIFHKLMNVF